MYVRRYTDAIHEKYPDFQVCSNWAFSDHLPVFVEDTFNSLSACMGPVAMILAGVTVARFNFVKMIKDKKVYLATLLRLVIIPVVIISALYTLMETIFK